MTTCPPSSVESWNSSKASDERQRTAAGAAQARRLIAPLLRTWYRVTVFEAESVPRNGPVLLVANHIGLLDAALLATASPRPVRTLAAEDLFAPPLDRLAGRGQIRIDPVNADAGALTSARRVLTDGEVLAVFPEGVRGDGDVRSIGHEAAYLALRSGAPVVPVALLGTRRAGMATDALPRRNTRLAAVFGTPSNFTPATTCAGAGDRIGR